MDVQYLDFPQVPWQQDERLCNKHIEVGEVVIVHGLKQRPDLNDRRAIVLKAVVDDKSLSRWSVKPLAYKGTIAVKPSNLKLPSQPAYKTHPDYMMMNQLMMKNMMNRRKWMALNTGEKFRIKARGITYASDPLEVQARKLAELLGCYYQGFRPNRTIILGVALPFYGAIPESSMENYTQQNQENNCAIFALMDMCQKEYMERNLPESEKEHIGNTELVIATLLEYNPVSFQALFMAIAITPYIGPIEEEPAIHKDSLDRCCTTPSLKGWTITPPQIHKDYIRVMLGYYCLLRFITDHTKESALGKVFLEVIAKHDLFPQFLERSINLVAREIMGTPDGLALGVHVRRVLANMCCTTGIVGAQFYNTFTAADPPKHLCAKKLTLMAEFTSSYDILYTIISKPIIGEQE